MLRVLEEIGWRSMSAETVGDVAERSSDAGRGGFDAAWLCPTMGRENMHAHPSADRSNMAGIEHLPTFPIGGRRIKCYNHMNLEATAAVRAAAQLNAVSVLGTRSSILLGSKKCPYLEGENEKTGGAPRNRKATHS